MSKQTNSWLLILARAQTPWTSASIAEPLRRQYHCIREAADPLHAYRHMLEAEATEAGVRDPDCMHLRAAAAEMNISGVQHAERKSRHEARRLH